MTNKKSRKRTQRAVLNKNHRKSVYSVEILSALPPLCSRSLALAEEAKSLAQSDRMRLKLNANRAVKRRKDNCLLDSFFFAPFDLWKRKQRESNSPIARSTFGGIRHSHVIQLAALRERAFFCRFVCPASHVSVNSNVASLQIFDEMQTIAAAEQSGRCAHQNNSSHYITSRRISAERLSAKCTRDRCRFETDSVALDNLISRRVFGRKMSVVSLLVRM